MVQSGWIFMTMVSVFWYPRHQVRIQFVNKYVSWWPVPAKRPISVISHLANTGKLPCCTCAEIVKRSRSTRKQPQSTFSYSSPSKRASYAKAKTKILNFCCKDALASMQLPPTCCFFSMWALSCRQHHLTWVKVIHLHSIWLQSQVCASWVSIMLLNQ